MTELTIDQALQQGIEAHKAGQVQEADRLYTAILKAQPKHPDANHNMGVLAVGIGKVEQALPFFKTALESSPTTAQFWLSYIDALIKLERLPEAQAVLDQAKNKGAKGVGFDQLEQRLNEASVVSPLNDTLTETLETNRNNALDVAIQLRENGDLNQAIDLLKDKINCFPEDVDMLAMLSHCHLLADEVVEAKLYLDRATTIAPNNASVRWNIARLALKEKSPLEALNIARDTRQRFPDDVEGMGVLGACLRANGYADESLEVLNRAIELNPNYAEALTNRALIRLSHENKIEALADLELAYRLKPHIKQIWDLVVGLKIEMQEYSDAIMLLINMIEIDPENENRLATLALCYQHLKDFDSAIEAYKKALAIKPDNVAAQTNLGSALKEQGKLEKALEAYNKALAIKPDCPEVYSNIGIALKDQGKLEDAIASYNKAIAIKPDYTEAYNNMGLTLHDQGKLEEAIEAYHKAIAIKPDYAEAYNNMGNALQMHGKSEEAIEAYNRAIAIKPDHAEAKHNLAETLKICSFKNNYHPLIRLNNKIKAKHSKETLSKDDKELAIHALNLLGELQSVDKNLRTKNLQIYRRNNVSLNCERHKKIFEEQKIIPEFCFGCYKVQVDVTTVLDLIRLAALFYEIEFESDLTRKCLVEVRPNIPGSYKGLVYCRGLDQAHSVKMQLDVHLGDIEGNLVARVKKGCSEFPLVFTEYGEVAASEDEMMQYPKEWRAVEVKFDAESSIIEKTHVNASLKEFCLSDYLIIQKWIDYAKGIDDPTSKLFCNLPIKYGEIWEIAKGRIKQ